MNYLRPLLTLIFLLAGTRPVLAQKQDQSQWLPSEAKADGKLTEWEGKLSAYNKSTRLSYLMANDETRLYLAVQSVDIAIIAKVMAGGITLTLDFTRKKKDDGPSLTFPRTTLGYTARPDGNKVSQDFRILRDSVTINAAIRDFGEIKVLRFTGVTDSIQSIYNDLEIRTKMTYAQGTFVYELIIPRSLLARSDRSGDFDYRVRLNGVPDPIDNPLPPGAPAGTKPGSLSAISAEIRSPTYFWDRYRLLTRKP